MDISKLSTKEKKELLQRAKDAYYNTGEEILTDAEYDALEKELGLENKNYVGSKAGNYTVKHSFLMGSLSKVQIIKKNDYINWDEAAEKINAFMRKAKGAKYLEATPKLDGCSFSTEFQCTDGKAELISVSTRGNGEWGTDIKHWFEPVLKTQYWSKIDDACNALLFDNDLLVIRGEILVPQSTFADKYSDQYVNPRAFTAGMVGLKYNDIDALKRMQGQDLHFVCYDYRIVDGDTGDVTEYSWMNPNSSTYSQLKPFLGHIGELIPEDVCNVYSYQKPLTPEKLEEIYETYNTFRIEHSEYALDGVVFKPECEARQSDVTRERPIDCIAMKFMPMLNSTEIVNIEWNVKKTGEYFPTAILAPIKMEDGKTITKASLHNYNYIINSEVGIGSTVRISLAGDIIPYVFEIIHHEPTDNNINQPADSIVLTDEKSGNMHLMKNFTEDEKGKQMFVSSAEVLNINNIGPATAKMLYAGLYEEFDDLTNIIYLMNDRAYSLIEGIFGTSKSIQTVIKELKSFAKKITLEDVIKSFCFKMCGERASQLCAKILTGASYSTSGFPEVAYSWALDKSSQNYYRVMEAVDMLGIDIEEMSEDAAADKIPIIMTGSPEDCTHFKTKQQWLQAHPEYIETTSWKECKILFTNDLESKTGKMQKAAKLGIEVRQYDDVQNESRKFDFNSTNALF